MNDILIEREVNERVRFKMSEFWTSFENHMKRNEYYKWASTNKDDIMRATHYIDAYEEIRGILRKEIDLPTALDGEIVKRNWEKKEEIVNKISDRVLDKGAMNYWPLKSFINNCIEDFIDG